LESDETHTEWIKTEEEPGMCLDIESCVKEVSGESVEHT
jgi:hypothetical protein